MKLLMTTTRLLSIKDIMLLSQCGKHSARKIKLDIQKMFNLNHNVKPTLSQYQQYYCEKVQDKFFDLNV